MPVSVVEASTKVIQKIDEWPCLVQNTIRGQAVLSRRTRLLLDAYFGAYVIVVDMIVVSGLVVMIVMADTDRDYYVDKNNEYLVSVVVTTAAEVVVAMVEAAS